MDKKDIYDFFRLWGNSYKETATIITLISENLDDLSCFLEFFKDVKMCIIYNPTVDSNIFILDKPNQFQLSNNDFYIYLFTKNIESFIFYEQSDFVIKFSDGLFRILKNRFNNVVEIDINGIVRKEKLDVLLNSF